jgi:hypothetical protein
MKMENPKKYGRSERELPYKNGKVNSIRQIWSGCAV